MPSSRPVNARSESLPVEIGGGGGVGSGGLVEPKLAGTAGRSRRLGVTGAGMGDAEGRQSQKMAALGALAAGIAHEFNNLLMTIATHTKLAREHPRARSLAEPLRPHLEGIEQAIEQAREMTRSLLMVARKEQPARQVVDLGVLVDEASSMFRRLLPASIRLKVEAHPHRWSVEANPDQLRQVLLNLVVNARDAMPSGGELRLSVQEAEPPTKCGGAGRRTRRGRWVALVVSDTGCGMDGEIASRVFEPFFTTKPRGAGTGIGLAIVAGIIEAHGGRVRCRSSPGEGSRFEVLLPALPVSTRTGRRRAAADKGGGGRT